MLAVAASIVGLIGITFALSYGVLLAGAAIMGFFLLAAGPIGFQYGAEVAYPAPEGTTTGLLLLVGQVSGIIFILGMDQFKQASSGSMTSSLVVLIGLMVVAALLSTRLRESTRIMGVKAGVGDKETRKQGNKETRMLYLVYMFPCLPVYLSTPLHPRAFAFSAFSRFITSFAPRPK